MVRLRGVLVDTQRPLLAPSRARTTPKPPPPLSPLSQQQRRPVANNASASGPTTTATVNATPSMFKDNGRTIFLVITLTLVALRQSPQFYSPGIIITTAMLSLVVRVFIRIHADIGLCTSDGTIFRVRKRGALASGASTHPAHLVIEFLFLFRSIIDQLLLGMFVLNSFGHRVTWTPKMFYLLFTELICAIYLIDRIGGHRILA